MKPVSDRSRNVMFHWVLLPSDQSMESSVLAVIHEVLPALLTGNTLVLKPAVFTPAHGPSSRRLHSGDPSARRFECDQRRG